MSLISIYDLKIHGDKTLNKKSLFVVEALKRMRRRRQFHEEEFEDVICPFELILMLDEVANDFNDMRGNENAVKERV